MLLNESCGEEDVWCKYNVTWHVGMTAVAMETTQHSRCSSQQWNIARSTCKVADIFLSDFDKILVFSTDFNARNHYQISLKSIQSEPSSCMRRDMAQLIDAFCDCASTLKMKDAYIKYTFLWSFMICEIIETEHIHSTTHNLYIFNSDQLSRHTWRLSKFQPFVCWCLSALYIKIQSVPHREHSVLSLKKNSVKAV